MNIKLNRIFKDRRTLAALVIGVGVLLAAATFAAGSTTPTTEQQAAIHDLDSQDAPAEDVQLKNAGDQMRPNTPAEQKAFQQSGGPVRYEQDTK
jgi:hypothetical protein